MACSFTLMQTPATPALILCGTGPRASRHLRPLPRRLARLPPAAHLYVCSVMTFVFVSLIFYPTVQTSTVDKGTIQVYTSNGTNVGCVLSKGTWSQVCLLCILLSIHRYIHPSAFSKHARPSVPPPGLQSEPSPTRHRKVYVLSMQPTELLHAAQILKLALSSLM